VKTDAKENIHMAGAVGWTLKELQPAFNPDYFMPK
jgi:hypothetical protein